MKTRPIVHPRDVVATDILAMPEKIANIWTQLLNIRDQLSAVGRRGQAARLTKICDDLDTLSDNISEGTQ